jgi:hypothetical protein
VAFSPSLEITNNEVTIEFVSVNRPGSGSAINWGYPGGNIQLSSSWPKTMLKGTTDGAVC